MASTAAARKVAPGTTKVKSDLELEKDKVELQGTDENGTFILVLDSSHKQAPQLRNNKPSALLAEPSETYSMKSKNRRAINQMHYSQTKTTTH